MLEDGKRFPQWIANRDDLRADHSIGALREKICENAWNKDWLCYVLVHEGCFLCDLLQRPPSEEWKQHLAECPLSERERVWIGKYERSLNGEKVAVTRGAPRWYHSYRQRSKYPLDAQCRAATRSPARPLLRLSTRSCSRGRGDNQSPRHPRSHYSRSRRPTSPYRSRDERKRSHSRAGQNEMTPFFVCPYDVWAIAREHETRLPCILLGRNPSHRTRYLRADRTARASRSIEVASR